MAAVSQKLRSDFEEVAASALMAMGEQFEHEMLVHVLKLNLFNVSRGRYAGVEVQVFKLVYKQLISEIEHQNQTLTIKVDKLIKIIK